MPTRAQARKAAAAAKTETPANKSSVSPELAPANAVSDKREHGRPLNEGGERNASVGNSLCPSGEEASAEVGPSPRPRCSTPTKSRATAEAIKADLVALKNSRPPQIGRVAQDRKATPTRQPPLHPPATPGSASPKKAALPLKYSQLLEMFKHLQMVYRMRRTKSVFLTFADAKASIQKATRKTFSIKHLAKIKYMIPEILQWQYIEGTSQSLTSERLIISFEMQPGMEQNPASDLAFYAELRERLSRHARRAALIGKEHEDIPEAELPDPSLCALVSVSKALSGRSNASSGYRSKSPSSVKPRKPGLTLTPVKRSEPASLPTLTPRRLTRVTEGTAEGVGESSWSKQTPQSSVRASLFSPCSHNRGIMRESFKRRMLMSPSKVKARARNVALQNLVTTLNDVRAVFHRFKTTKRPLKDVLQAMRLHTKSRYTEDAALLHLHLLLEHAPQFVRLEPATVGKEIVSIDRECNVPAIKEMLRELAAQRPSIDVTEEAVEKRLSEFDGLDL